MSFAGTRDMVMRDNLADTGAVASTGAFWNSPTSGAAPPIRRRSDCARELRHAGRIRIRGGSGQLVCPRPEQRNAAAVARRLGTHSVTYPGLEFTYPASFQPSNGPGDPTPMPMVPGTYFIGEAKVTGVPPAGDVIVSVLWPSTLIPPAEVMTGSGTVHWHPCLLAEVTPHDGPTPTGNHVWDDNNLAQKNVTIVDTDAGTDFALATVIGHEDNKADHLLLEVNRGRLPSEVELYVDLLDPILRRRLRAILQTAPKPPVPKELVLAGDIRGIPLPETVAAPGSQLAALLQSRAQQDWRIGLHKGKEVVFLRTQPRVQVPILAGHGRLSLVVVGGVVARRSPAYEIVLTQRVADRHSGSAMIPLD